MNKQEIVIYGAFDKRDANPHKNYGIHGMEIRFYLYCSRAVMQFVVYTPLHLPHVHDELWGKHLDSFIWQPIGADIGYHSYEPQYEDQPSHANCSLLDGAPCYYDGTSLGAQELPEFLAGGSAVVWPMLQEWYDKRFKP